MQTANKEPLAITLAALLLMDNILMASRSSNSKGANIRVEEEVEEEVEEK